MDFENPDANDWLAVNQFTVIEGQHNRRPDIVVFVNGLPLGVIELKNAAKTRHLGAAATTSCRPTSRRFPRCCTTTRCWWSPTASRRASARSRPTRNGSRSGARLRARATRQLLRWSWRCWCAACSSSGGSSICSALHRLRGRPG